MWWFGFFSCKRRKENIWKALGNFLPKHRGMLSIPAPGLQNKELSLQIPPWGSVGISCAYS